MNKMETFILLVPGALLIMGLSYVTYDMTGNVIATMGVALALGIIQLGIALSVMPQIETGRKER